MNNPAYIVTEVFGNIVEDVKTKLAREVGYHYGDVKELNETLIQMTKSPNLFDKKFPLVWLMEPFTVESRPFIFGRVENLRLFVMTNTNKNYKSHERKTKTFIPTLYPIRDEIIRQTKLNSIFSDYPSQFRISVTDYYYWGEAQQSVLNDIVDTIEINFRNLLIKNNKNCIKN